MLSGPNDLKSWQFLPCVPPTNGKLSEIVTRYRPWVVRISSKINLGLIEKPLSRVWGVHPEKSEIVFNFDMPPWWDHYEKVIDLLWDLFTADHVTCIMNAPIKSLITRDTPWGEYSSSWRGVIPRVFGSWWSHDELFHPSQPERNPNNHTNLSSHNPSSQLLIPAS